MATITTKLVKELRELTGAGIMDCKKALVEANGVIELAINNMRKHVLIKAAKKSDKITNNGIIKIQTNANYGAILEVNCQTDFVAKNDNFKSFVNKILNVVLTKKINNIQILKNQFEEERITLVATIGENIDIRRVSLIKGKFLGSYTHNSRIGVLISAANFSNKEKIKQIAMHIAASKPEFIRPENIPTQVIEKERLIQLDIAQQTSKSRKIIEKIVEGRMEKYFRNITLINQIFILDQNKTVGQFMQENDIQIVDFIRFEIGDFSKKDKINFSTE